MKGCTYSGVNTKTSKINGVLVQSQVNGPVLCYGLSLIKNAGEDVVIETGKNDLYIKLHYSGNGCQATKFRYIV